MHMCLWWCVLWPMLPLSSFVVYFSRQFGFFHSTPETTFSVGFFSKTSAAR